MAGRLSFVYRSMSLRAASGVMGDNGRTPVLVITGPTASGKSALALAVAERLGGEIISMDSRQVYRGMDIGTAKPTAADQQSVVHHGLDLIDPGERYSAGQFARDARKWIDDIRSRGKTPVVVGGTMFFLRALAQPLFDEPELDADRRDRLRAFLNAADIDMLRKWAVHLQGGAGTTADGAIERAAVGPVAGTTDLPIDRQRLARLIEVATLTGCTLSDWHRRSAPYPDVPVVTFVMTLARTALYRRIDERVHDMVRQGFVAEVDGLVARGFGGESPGMNATGYQELVPHVGGTRTLDEAVTLIQAASRQYARRQLTWLRTQVGPDVHELDATLPIPQLVDRVESMWRQEAA